MKVVIAPIPMSCALDIIISSFCNVLLCSVLKLMLGVDCYPFKPQGLPLRSIDMQFGCEIIIIVIVMPCILKCQVSFMRDKSSRL